MQTSRRHLLAGSAAVFVASLASGQAEAQGLPMVVNTLGSLNPDNATAMAAAREAGLTTTSNTIGDYDNGPIETAYSRTLKDIADWDDKFARHPEKIIKVLTVGDILEARKSGRIGVFLNTQSSSMLEGKVERVDALHRGGVRVFQLTYNRDNALGGGLLSPTDAGLTAFGRKAIDRIHQVKGIVDLSHSGTAMCLDSARYSSRPIAITHTGCRALTDLPRNKTDEELRLVASKGGYVGIFTQQFLAVDRRATDEDFFRHVAHAFKVCGEDHVGVGTDDSVRPRRAGNANSESLAGWAAIVRDRKQKGISAPGEDERFSPLIQELQGPEQFRIMSDGLKRHGFTPRQVEKFLGGNFIAFAKSAWG